MSEETTLTPEETTPETPVQPEEKQPEMQTPGQPMNSTEGKEFPEIEFHSQNPEPVRDTNTGATFKTSNPSISL